MPCEDRTDHAWCIASIFRRGRIFRPSPFPRWSRRHQASTSYTPSPTQQPPAQGTLYWRAIAIDQANAVQSGASETQSFAYYTPTEQNRIALQLGVTLWPGVRPPGTYGHAVMGPGWQVGIVTSFTGVVFQSPPLEMLQLFDLLDLGFEPYERHRLAEEQRLCDDGGLLPGGRHVWLSASVSVARQR